MAHSKLVIGESLVKMVSQGEPRVKKNQQRMVKHLSNRGKPLTTRRPGGTLGESGRGNPHEPRLQERHHITTENLDRGPWPLPSQQRGK